jgi:hypothetical protein
MSTLNDDEITGGSSTFESQGGGAAADADQDDVDDTDQGDDSDDSDADDADVGPADSAS